MLPYLMKHIRQRDHKEVCSLIACLMTTSKLENDYSSQRHHSIMTSDTAVEKATFVLSRWMTKAYMDLALTL